MSSGKGKVAGDREESCWRLRVQQRREKGEKKQRKNRDERVLYALKMGKKQSPTEMRNGGKKQRKNREERVLYALKRGKKNRVQQR